MVLIWIRGNINEWRLNVYFCEFPEFDFVVSILFLWIPRKDRERRKRIHTSEYFNWNSQTVLLLIGVGNCSWVCMSKIIPVRSFWFVCLGKWCYTNFEIILVDVAWLCKGKNGGKLHKYSHHSWNWIYWWGHHTVFVVLSLLKISRITGMQTRKRGQYLEKSDHLRQFSGIMYETHVNAQ